MSGERYSIEEGGTLDGRNVAEIYTAAQGEVGTPTGGLIRQRLRRGLMEKKDPPGGGSKGGDYGRRRARRGDCKCGGLFVRIVGCGVRGGTHLRFGGWGSVSAIP